MRRVVTSAMKAATAVVAGGRDLLAESGRAPFSAVRPPRKTMADYPIFAKPEVSTASGLSGYSVMLDDESKRILRHREECIIKDVVIDRDLAQEWLQRFEEIGDSREIILDNCEIDEDAIDDFAEVLKRAIDGINIRNCKLEKNLGMLLQKTEASSRISLEINNCATDLREDADAFFGAIAECNFRMVSIKGSILGDAKQDDEVIGKFLANNHQIKSLDCDLLPDSPATCLARALEEHPSLETLFIYNTIKGEEAVKIAHSLEKNSVMTGLSIRPDLKDDQVVEFCNAIENNVALREIGIPNQEERYDGLHRKISEVTNRNYYYIRDTVNDYAKTILGARFAVVNRYSEDGEVPFASYKLYLHDAAKKVLFDGITSSEIADFCKFWHEPLTQTKTLKLKDYGGRTWESLVGDKEIAVPEEVVGGRRGIKMVELLSPEELRQEGENLKHCVGGYAGNCLSGASHIFSIVDKDGRSLSTVEYIFDGGDVEQHQHSASRNSEPQPYLINASSWFLDQIKFGKLNVSCEVGRVERDGDRELYFLGYDPFDEKKYHEVCRSFRKDMIPKGRPYSEKIARNLERLISDEVILSTDAVGVGGWIYKHPPFVIPPKFREVKVFSQSEEQRQENIARKAAETAKVFFVIQENLNRLFGDDVIKAELEIVEGQRRVAFTSDLKSDILHAKLSKIPAFVKDGSLEIIEQDGKISVLAKKIGPAHLAEALAATPLAKVSDSKVSSLEAIDLCRSCL